MIRSLLIFVFMAMATMANSNPAVLAEESMDQLLSAMDESYPRLDRLGEGWPLLCRKFRREAGTMEDEKAFEWLVKGFIERLKDQAIIYMGRRSQRSWWPSPDPRSGDLKKLHDYESQVGWIDDDICYILLNQPGFYPQGKAWLEQAASARGILLDLRVKSGKGHNSRRGNQNELLKFAGLLTETALPYGTRRQRAGEAGVSLSEPDTLWVHPLIRTRPRLPVVCLIDPSVKGHLVELALILKAIPHIRLVGTDTGFLLNEARTVDMKFGGRVWIPLHRTYSLDGRELTNRSGVQPDIPVNSNRDRKTAFDAGVETLRLMMEGAQQ